MEIGSFRDFFISGRSMPPLPPPPNPQKEIATVQLEQIDVFLSWHLTAYELHRAL